MFLAPHPSPAMPHWFSQLFVDRRLRRQILRRGILWSLVVVAFLGLGTHFSHQEGLGIALTRARDAFQKEKTSRLWVMQRGGVYVALGESTAVDPTQTGVPALEITTTTGQVLTLVDPIHAPGMSLQQGQTGLGLQVHITSLNPLRERNAADPWEAKALKQLEAGAREYWEELKLGKQTHLRYMGALITEESCLHCHAAQGYRVGDVKGGISITAPLEGGAKLIGGIHNRTTLVGVFLVWVAGLWVILLAARWNLGRIAERNQAQEMLRLSEERFRRMADQAPVLIWMSDSEQRCTYFNKVWLDFTGRSLEQEIGDGWAEGVHPDDQQWSKAAFSSHFEQRVDFRLDYRLRRADGEYRWILDHGTPRFDAHGIFLGYIGSCFDITERKQAESALMASEAMYRELLDRQGEGFSMVDEGERFLIVNPVAEAIFGVSPGSLVGRSLWDFLSEEQQARVRTESEHRAEGRHSTYELEIRREDGTLRNLLVTATPRASQGESATQVIGVFRDLTERKLAEQQQRQLQAQLQQAQKMESLGSLAGGVAHDMNNVLGAILGLASANIEDQPAGSPAQRAFGTIIKAAERGGKTIRSLLGFARNSAIEERELQLNALLQEEIHLLEHSTFSNIHLEMELEPDLRPIRGDASALTNAFMNLAVNAVDAMQGKGTLTFRTRSVDTDWIEVRVEDTGCGMPKEVLDKAMDPFFTTKEVGKGTGLGLSMVYRTVKAHQGQIEIQSEPGHGTRVVMRFPAWEPVVLAAGPIHEALVQPALGVLDVLVVDDDEMIQSTMEAILEVLGHRISLAQSGEEALAKLEAGLQPDVVILDMNMPGLGGSGTLPRLRALRPTLPVLLATGRSDQTSLDLVEAHPGVILLTKPFGMKDLKKHLEPLLRKAPTALP